MEGLVQAQAAVPDLSSKFKNLSDNLKEFGNTLVDKTPTAIDHTNTPKLLPRLELFSDIQKKAKKFKDTFS
jgi:hypothetical protein